MLFCSKKNGVGEYSSYSGQEVLGAYQWIPSLSWGILNEVPTQEAYARLYELQQAIWLTTILAVLATALAVYLIASNTGKRVRQMADLAEHLSQGEIEQQETLKPSRDEVGALASSFQKMILYQQNMAKTADRISQGQLGIRIQPLSEKDVLGNAFRRMVDLLRQSFVKIKDNAVLLDNSAAHMNNSAAQSGQATSQIAITISQIAQGSNQQAISISQTAYTIEELSNSVQKLSADAAIQAAGIKMAAELTSEIDRGLNSINSTTDSVSRISATSLQSVEKGSRSVSETMQSMQNIRQRMGVLRQKVEDTGQSLGADRNNT